MEFNSTFKGLTLTLPKSTKWWAPASASKWRMGFNSAFKGLKTNISRTEFYTAWSDMRTQIMI
jgi:hypothetical protein